MKDEFELEIGPGGVIKTLYQDGIEEFAKEIGADIASVCRLTNVEWQEDQGIRGWTVRAEHDPRFCLRYITENGQRTFKPYYVEFIWKDVVIFKTREAALEAEVRFASEFIAARAAWWNAYCEKTDQLKRERDERDKEEEQWEARRRK